MAGLVPAVDVLLNCGMADGGKPSEGRRFLDVLSSGHPGEIVSELLQEYALLRRLIFAALVLPFALYGNWNMTLGVAGIWALYEAMAWLTRWWRGRA